MVKVKNPYPSNTPEYNKFWHLLKKGKTHDEAIELMKTWVPRGRNGYLISKPPEEFAPTPQSEENQEQPPDKIPEKDDLSRIIIALERIVVLLGGINGSLHRISKYTHECVRETVDFTKTTMPPEPSHDTKHFKTTINGWAGGTKVKRVSNGDIGVITRVMPGRHDVEVKFLIGTKTLSINDLVVVK